MKVNEYGTAAELVLMFPERFREEVICFMKAHE